MTQPTGKAVSEFNGTVRYNVASRKWQTSCEICWDGPKGDIGQGFASDCTTEGRARMGLSNHIANTHGHEPNIKTGEPIQ